MHKLARPGALLLGALIACSSATPARGQSAAPVTSRGRNYYIPPSATIALHRQVDAIRAEALPALAHGDYARAEGILRRALAVDKTDAQSWVLLADVCEHLGKTDDAIQAYRAMIYSKGWGSSINHDPTTVMRYVLLLSKKGAWPEAAAVYNDAEQRKMAGTGRPLAGFRFSERTPDWPGLKAAAGFVLGTYHVSYAHGQTVDQVKHLEQAIKYRPNWPEAQIAYADCMLKKGEIDKAEGAYKIVQSSTDWSLRLRAKDGLWAVSYRRAHPASKESLASGSPTKEQAEDRRGGQPPTRPGPPPTPTPPAGPAPRLDSRW